MNDYNGIAWMIAGGVRAESSEDQRQRRQRVELAQMAPAGHDLLVELRQRFAAIVGLATVESTGSSRLAADCCTA
jgi:hypothetical protein